jgi:adenylate cyclase
VPIDYHAIADVGPHVDEQAMAVEAFRREQEAGELKMTRVALLVCVAGLVFALLAASGTNARLGLWLCVLPVTATVYYSALILVLRAGRYRAWMSYLSSTLEVSVATVVGILDARFVSADYALTSAPQVLYFLAVSATALRFRWRLSIYAGVLAAAQVAVFYLIVVGRISAVTATLPSMKAAIYLQRCGYLVIAGLAAAAMSTTARRLASSVSTELRRRWRMRRLFGRYVPDDVAASIIERGMVTTEGELREVTVLCSDVRGFTAMCQELPPEEVVRFLNALFEEQSAIVGRHGGRVDKFIGDGMLAIFGAPVPLEDHALSGARAALEIAAIDSVAVRGLPRSVSLGVALHTGEAVIGHLGSRDHLEYTAIGDVVNLAFRIEGLNARFATRVLLSEEVQRRLGARARVTAHGPSRVRGVQHEITTYELHELSEP